MSDENFMPPENFKTEVDKSEQVVVIPKTIFNYIIIAITFLVVGVLIGVFALDKAPQNSGLTETQVEVIMRRVLAETSQTGTDTAASTRFDLVDDDPYLGPADAPVVIVEFSDFFCTFCKRHFDQTFTPLLENYGKYVRYVYRDFAQLTPESKPAAIAAQCAFEQGKFWEFHNEFFNHQADLGHDFYIATAEKFGLDVEAYTKCIDEARYDDEVGFDYLDGQLEGVRGTPGFFVNGLFISGAQPYELFERVIQRELVKAGIDPATITTTNESAVDTVIPDLSTPADTSSEDTSAETTSSDNG